MNGSDLIDLLREHRVIAVARDLDPEQAPGLAAALHDGGVRILEITVEVEGGLGAISALGGSELVIGAGTVTGVGQAAAAVEAGAAFLVSPHHDSTLTRWAARRDVPFIPAGFTPTEIVAAWSAGTPAVKVFPASLGGPDLIAALKGPFPGIELIPTGGINADDAAAYLRAGALAVGIGGWLTGHQDLALVTERAAQAAKAVGAV
jgi:2-dehydro-3-deoxyphosphogluconate aldolase/(4S)-4-hydroxy-2-oxoglutarate aldolase